MADILKGQLPNILKYTTVLAVIVFISFLFPTSTGFSYKFKKGQNWIYEDLVAEYSFPLLKQEEKIEEEKGEIKNDFLPFYDKNSQVSETVKDSFNQLLSELKSRLQLRGEVSGINNNTEAYRRLGENTIDDIYSSYVISEQELKEDTADTELIRIVDKTITNTVSRSSLLPLSKVKSNLMSRLSSSSLKDVDYLIPILDDVIQPNTFFNAQRTKNMLQARLDDVATTRGIIEKGETIVAENELITPSVYQRIISYEKKYDTRNVGDRKNLIVFLGYLLLTTLIVGVFLLFLQFNARPVYDRYKSLLFMLIWIVIYSYLVSVIDSTGNLSIYMIPFCIVPILVINFFSDRLAMFTHIVIILIASFLSKEGYEFTFLQIFAGIVTVLTFEPSRYWFKFFKSILFIFLAYILGYFGLSLIRTGSLDAIRLVPFVWLFISSFMTLLAFTLVPLLERLFGFTSNITLSELSDLNRPLLKRLSAEAPGTFQHSLQVSNLSEAAAEEIGANALLVKVSALYHDVGKLKHPQYFIENQGNKNPHTDLEEKESARLIIEHVTEGVKVAKKQSLPKVVIDFIKTHHGTTRVEYFYQLYKENNPDLNVDPSAFTYPGPRPSTKEEAIMMMADSLEASSKSLKSPTADDIDELVESIIKGKIDQEQLSNSDLTFRDLKKCKVVFKKMLKSINHVRVEYPDKVK